jgi:MFS family permease
MMALLSPFAGRLSDRVEPRVISSIGMGITALGLMLLIFLDDHTALLYLIASLIILGFGFALFSSPNMNAIMGSVDKRYYGIASASVGTMRLLGQMVSMGIVTLMFALFIGRARITPQYYPMLINSIKVVFIISFCLCVCGIFFSLYRGRLRPDD